eukprot:5543703-Amphidinium_carterae.1
MYVLRWAVRRLLVAQYFELKCIARTFQADLSLPSMNVITALTGMVGVTASQYRISKPSHDIIY